MRRLTDCLGNSMYISGVGTSTPIARYTKAECLTAFQASDWYVKLDARAHLIVSRTMLQKQQQ